MNPLTDRVLKVLKDRKSDHLKLIEAIKKELDEEAHIEHILSHLGDYSALAERSRDRKCKVGAISCDCDSMAIAHHEIVSAIADTIRWGYRAKTDTNSESVGEAGKSIVCVEAHRAFVSAVFKTAQAGLQDRRSPVRFFTTNYDTLLEDSLSIECIPYWDGFSGGAVAYRNYHFGQSDPKSDCRAHVVKLHGSIDWHLVDEGHVLRVRDGDTYPADSQRVLIYPQSTKYAATQKDPFAAQFDLLRRTLSMRSDNVLAVCGYSFCDTHVNDEIEQALRHPESKTTLIAFSSGVPGCVKKWQEGAWGNRVYAITKQGVSVGQDEPQCEPEPGEERTWWTFKGATAVLQDGAASYL